MRFGIVITDPHDWTAQAIKKSFTKYGAKAIFLSFSDLVAKIGCSLRIKCGDIDLAELDGLVVRDLGRRGSHDVAFRFETLCTLEKLGLPIVNPPQAIQNAANKFSTFLALHDSEVPHPKTTVTTSLEIAEKALSEYGTAVSKPLFGYKGKGLALLTSGDLDQLAKILDDRGVIYLQEFLESPAPRDIRVFVVGDKVAGAIYRVAPPGSWISNLSRGGAPQPCPISEEIEDLAKKANQSVGTIYSGVDLMETPEGLKVIEVNGTPSGRGIFRAWNIDVGQMIASHVLSLIR
ncbi:MAG: RimK family alpha-L-glutamate ligase [Methanotrichaceae archaeon]